MKNSYLKRYFFISLFPLFLVGTLFANSKDVLLKKQHSISALVQVAIANENKKGHALYIAGKERALTQKMTKEALLIALNIDVYKNRAYLKQSAKMYERILKAFVKGDKELKIVPAKNPKIINYIKEVMKDWRKFHKHLKPFYNANKISAKDLRYIINNNEELLRVSNRLFLMVKNEDNFDNKLTDSMINAIDFAGRESMLSQKIVKEKLLILNGINVEANKGKLRGSFILFDRALRGLLDGNEKRGLSPVAVSHIRKELLAVKTIWMNMIPVIFKEDVNREDLSRLVSLNIPLMKKSNKVVRMYEDLADLY